MENEKEKGRIYCSFILYRTILLISDHGTQKPNDIVAYVPHISPILQGFVDLQPVRLINAVLAVMICSDSIESIVFYLSIDSHYCHCQISKLNNTRQPDSVPR